MKLLTITVPCYQSQDYLRHCVQTLLGGGDEVEIIIVNDGSTDATGDIAEGLQAEHPEMIRVIHQPNGGHGAAVMTGLRNATGQYFKVVDSDDWLDEKALGEALAGLRTLDQEQSSVDMLLCNYVYDKVGAKHKRVVRYKSAFPQGRVCTWDEAKRFYPGQYILMHSVIYRTGLLRGCGLDLPHHTFYVDNLFVYLPMQHVRTLLYLNLDLYHYFIGREDQSVNEQVMIKRIDQHLTVNKMMLESVDLKSDNPRQQQRYMQRYMEIVTVVSSILLFRDGNPESLAKKQALWDYIRQTNPSFYHYLTKRSWMGFFIKNDGVIWRRISLLLYGICQACVGFN